MLDITKDIQSLTTFRRRSGDFMRQLKKSKRPVVLTVKGKAAAIVQDAGAYQRLLNIAARADANEGIRQGLEEARLGKGRSAEEFFAEFETAHDLSGEDRAARAERSFRPVPVGRRAFAAYGQVLNAVADTGEQGLATLVVWPHAAYLSRDLSRGGEPERSGCPPHPARRVAYSTPCRRSNSTPRGLPCSAAFRACLCAAA